MLRPAHLDVIPIAERDHRRAPHPTDLHSAGREAEQVVNLNRGQPPPQTARRLDRAAQPVQVAPQRLGPTGLAALGLELRACGPDLREVERHVPTIKPRQNADLNGVPPPLGAVFDDVALKAGIPPRHLRDRQLRHELLFDREPEARPVHQDVQAFPEHRDAVSRGKSAVVERDVVGVEHVTGRP